jgi:peroxiredoxin (alkyl hydroperoxide reductase subunit C)
MQTADAYAVATPADWQSGNDVIVPTAGSCGVAKDRKEINKKELPVMIGSSTRSNYQ